MFKTRKVTINPIGARATPNAAIQSHQSRLNHLDCVSNASSNRICSISAAFPPPGGPAAATPAPLRTAPAAAKAAPGTAARESSTLMYGKKDH
jgi:hypothetical protein